MEEAPSAALLSPRREGSGRRHAKDTATILKNDWGHNVFFSFFYFQIAPIRYPSISGEINWQFIMFPINPSWDPPFPKT